MAMELSDVFRGVNLFVGVAIIIGGIGQFITGQVNNMIIAVYLLVYGLGIGFLEFRIPAIISRYTSFLFSFLGRGLFYLFCACLMPTYHTLWIVAGVIVAACGVGYIGLHFVPSIEPPANMREAESSWGVEQI